MTTRKHFLEPSAEVATALTRGFQLMVELAAQDSATRNWVLLVPQLGSLQSTALSQFLGSASTKALLDGKVLSLYDVKIQLHSLRTMSATTPADAVIAVYADQKTMDLIDSHRALKAVIAMPFSAKDIEPWTRAWSPQTAGVQAPPAVLIQDAVIVAALTSLTYRINLGNRVLNPRDEDAVLDAFRILRAHGHSADPKSIRAWCVRHGWYPQGADDAMKHAEKVFGAKSKPKTYGSQWAPDIYAQWKASPP